MKTPFFAALFLVALLLKTSFAQKGTIQVRELESITIDGDISDWQLDNFETVLELPTAPAGLEAESLDLQGDHLVYNIDQVGFFGGATADDMTDGGPGDFEATTYFAYDSEFFYMLSVVTDEMLRGDKDPSAVGNEGFRNDGIEFFLDPGGDSGDCVADGATFQDQDPNRDDMQITVALNDSFLPDGAAPNQLGARHGVERGGNPLLVSAPDGEKNGPGGLLRDALDALDEPNIAAMKTDDGYVIEFRIPFGFIPEFSPDNVMRYTHFWNDADTDDGPGNAAISRITWGQQTTTRCTDEDDPAIGLFHSGTWAAMEFVTDNPLTPQPGPTISLRKKADFGQLDTAPAVQEFTIPVRNNGITNPLAIESITVSGANADRFTVVSFPSSLDVKSSGDIVVSFDSQGIPGSYEAVLEVANNDTDAEDQARQVLISVSAVNLSGPIAHYNLDESDGAVMNDVTGFDRHGEYDDVTLGQEALAAGTSARFGGGTASVPVSALGIHPRFSVSIWFNGDTFDGQLSTLFGQGLAGGSPGYALLATGTELQWFVGDADEFSGGPITAGTSHHTVVTYGPDKATIYLDGVEVGSIDSPSELDVAIEDKFYIGSYAKALPFAGRLDDLQIYDRIISADDVASLFNNPGRVLASGGGPVEEPEPEPAGDWMLVHDFEGLDEGPLDGVGGWDSADAGTQVGSDDGNKALESNAPGQNAYVSLGGTIPSGRTGTVFFRARAGEMPDFVLGVSDVVAPDAWDSYEGYLRFSGTNIDVRDGGGFAPVVENFSMDTWYNLWLVLDNDALEATLYYSTGDEAAQLGGQGGFRMTNGNTEHGDIINFLVRTGNAHTTGQLDDIYLASGENLTIPGAGGWVVTSDLEGLDASTVNGQGGWVSSTPDTTLIVSDGGNQALEVMGAGQNAYVPLASVIPSGTTGTVFFRARAGEMPDFVLGVSDVAAPDAWDSYEGYLRFAGTNIDVRDGGGFTPAFENFNVDTWYNLWLVLNNEALEATLYYSTGEEAAQLGAVGGFRMTNGNTEHGDIINFLVRSGNAHVSGQVDDIYVDASGENLTIPQPVLQGGGGDGSDGLLGLIGYWPLDGSAADVSGQGADGNVINPDGVWVEDGGRSAYQSGNGSFIELGMLPVIALDTDFTWSFWVNADETDNNNIVFGNRWGPDGVDFAPREFVKFTPRAFEWHVGGAGQNVPGDNTMLVVGEWTHNLVVKSGTTVTYYRNGVEIATSEITEAPANAQPLYLGGQDGREVFSGKFDEVAIFDRTLSASEVTDVYNRGLNGEALNSGGGPVVVEPLPTNLTNVGIQASGAFGMTLPGGVTADVEYSTDLISWETIASGVTGSYEDTNVARADAATGFYRGVVK